MGGMEHGGTNGSDNALGSPGWADGDGPRRAAPSAALSTPDTTGLVDVILLGIPVQLVAHEQSRHRDLVREFALMRIGANTDGGPPVHFELLSLLDELDRFRSYSAPAVDDLEQAFHRGMTAVDLTLRVPSAIAPLLERLRVVYDRVDVYSRDDNHLLTLPPSPQAAALRGWYLGEFPRQISGAQPRPWGGPMR